MNRTLILSFALCLGLPSAALAQTWSPCGKTKLKQIAVRYHNEVYGVTNKNTVYKYDGSRWTLLTGSIKRIAVSRDGQVWGLTNKNYTTQYKKGRWVNAFAGAKTDLDVGNGRTFWTVDSRGTCYELVSGTWVPRGNGLKAVDVGEDGAVVGINTSNQLVIYGGRGFFVLKQAHFVTSAVSVSNRNSMWCISSKSQIWRWNNPSKCFDHIPGKLVDIDVGYDGTVMGLDSNGRVYKYTPNRRKAQPKPRPKPQPKPKPMAHVTTIGASPSSVTLKCGQTVKINGCAYDQFKRPMANAQLSYAGSGGTFRGNHYTAGNQAGQFNIWVTHRSSRVSRVVNVTILQPAMVTKITVRASPTVVYPGQKLTIHATAIDQFGKAMPHVQLSYKCARNAGTFHGPVFTAGRSAGRVTLWVSHSGTNIARSCSITIKEPIRLAHLVVVNPVQRLAGGRQIALVIKAFDQYNRPLKIRPYLKHLGVKTSKGAYFDKRRCTFFAPKSPGHHWVKIYYSQEVYAYAYIYVHP